VNDQGRKLANSRRQAGTVVLSPKRPESIVYETGTRVKGGICRSTVLIGNILSSCKLSARKTKGDSDLVDQAIESSREDCRPLIHYVRFPTGGCAERMAGRVDAERQRLVVHAYPYYDQFRSLFHYKCRLGPFPINALYKNIFPMLYNSTVLHCSFHPRPRRHSDTWFVAQLRHPARSSEIIHSGVSHYPVHPRRTCHTACRRHLGSQGLRDQPAGSLASWLRSPWDVWRGSRRRSGIA